MSGVLFTYTGTGVHSAGVIAQEQGDVTPELVITTPEGYKAVNYGGFGAYSIEGINELTEQIADLKVQAAALKEKQDG